MRVALVCADRGIPAGGTKGASVHLRDFAAALAARGHHVEAHLARADGPFPVPVRPLAAEDELVARLAAFRPHVVHERYSLGGRTGLAAARAAGCPFVLEVNAPLVAEAGAHRPDSVGEGVAAVEAELLAAADVVVTVSEPLRRWAADVRGSADGVAVLPNGVDGARFTRPAPMNGPPTIAFLGHPKPWHGGPRLAGIVAGVRERGLDARLLLIGGGDGAAEVAAACRTAGVIDAVTITGPLAPTEAAAALRTAWIGAAPYPMQDFFYFSPLKVVEYLAAGLPVVATAQGDLADVVAGDGVLVPPGDDDALVAAVASLLRDRDGCRRIGRRGRHRVLRERTWAHVAARWEAIVTPAVQWRAA